MIALFWYYLHRKCELPVGRAFAFALPAGLVGDMMIAIVLKGLLT